MHSARNVIVVCLLSSVAILLAIFTPQTGRGQQKGPPWASEPPMEKDGPPDITHYSRPAIPEDYAPGGRPALPQPEAPGTIFPTAFVRDVVVSNTNPNLVNILKNRFKCDVFVLITGTKLISDLQEPLL